MNTQTISDVSDISEKHLRQLYLLQKQCWGSEPFREFQICGGCSKLFSTQEVLQDNPVSIGQVEFCCPSCNVQTNDVYDVSFMDEIRKYFEYQMHLVLVLSDTDDIQGFGVMTKKSIADILAYEFDTRPESYDPKELADFFSVTGFGDVDSSLQEVLLLHQIYMIPELRGSGTAFYILRQMFESFYDCLSLPTVLETRYDSGLYPITRTLGFQDAPQADRYGYIPQILPDSSDILTSIEAIREQTDALHRHRVHAQNTMTQNPGFSDKRFYFFND